jgi:hypothetical protein
MFDRKESIAQAIRDKSIDSSTLKRMIDLYILKEKITEVEKAELIVLMEPSNVNT